MYIIGYVFLPPHSKASQVWKNKCVHYTFIYAYIHAFCVNFEFAKQLTFAFVLALALALALICALALALVFAFALSLVLAFALALYL